MSETTPPTGPPPVAPPTEPLPAAAAPPTQPLPPAGYPPYGAPPGGFAAPPPPPPAGGRLGKGKTIAIVAITVGVLGGGGLAAAAVLGKDDPPPIGTTFDNGVPQVPSPTPTFVLPTVTPSALPTAPLTPVLPSSPGAVTPTPTPTPTPAGTPGVLTPSPVRTLDPVATPTDPGGSGSPTPRTTPTPTPIQPTPTPTPTQTPDDGSFSIATLGDEVVTIFAQSPWVGLWGSDDGTQVEFATPEGHYAWFGVFFDDPSLSAQSDLGANRDFYINASKYVELTWGEVAVQDPFGSVVSFATIPYSGRFGDNQSAIDVTGELGVLVRNDGAVLALVNEASPPENYLATYVEVFSPIVGSAFRSFGGTS